MSLSTTDPPSAQLSSTASAAAAAAVNAALSSQHLLEQVQTQPTQGYKITAIIFIPVRTISHFPVTLSHLPGFILGLSMSAWLSCSIFTSSPAAPPANFLPVHVLALQDDQPYANRVDLNFLLCHSASPCPELTLPPRALLREGDTEKDRLILNSPFPTPRQPLVQTHSSGGLTWPRICLCHESGSSFEPSQMETRAEREADGKTMVGIMLGFKETRILLEQHFLLEKRI